MSVLGQKIFFPIFAVCNGKVSHIILFTAMVVFILSPPLTAGTKKAEDFWSKSILLELKVSTI